MPAPDRKPQVTKWTPPSAGQPSRWQREVAARWLEDRRAALADRLADALGAAVDVRRVRLTRSPLPPDAHRIAEACAVDRDLAIALASAALGYGRPARVDIDGRAERALLRHVAAVAIGWLGGPPPPHAAAVTAAAEVRCAESVGWMYLQASWDHVWRQAARSIASHRLGDVLNPHMLRVRATAVLQGPKLTLRELCSLTEGHFLVLPEGAGNRAVIVAAGAAVALGTLGVYDGKWAVRIERLPEESADNEQ